MMSDDLDILSSDEILEMDLADMMRKKIEQDKLLDQKLDELMVKFNKED